jgi:hypothetical protein
VYLALLQRKADGIGAPQGNIAAKIGAGRFLVPVALVAGLAARHASDSTVREKIGSDRTQRGRCGGQMED